MDDSKTIVCVSASFASGSTLQEMLNKYAQYKDDNFAYRDNYAFTALTLPSCDAFLVFNSPSATVNAHCDPAKIIAFMMEPGYAYEHPWMFRNIEQYAKVFSPVEGKNVIPSHGFLGWYPDWNYSKLKQLAVPGKTKPASCIVSGLSRLPGHRERLGFVSLLRKVIPSIDFFGKHTSYLRDKMDGLLPYRYSIAIENCAKPHYFTEKINDCFLAYTVPVYFGCSNIDKYFPSRSFIQIDIRDSERAIQQIAQLLEEDDWETRLPALEEARQLVLEKYQPLAGAAGILDTIEMKSKKQIHLNPVSRTFTDRIKAHMQSRQVFFFSPRKRASLVT